MVSADLSIARTARQAWGELKAALVDVREPVPCEAFPEVWFGALGMSDEARAGCRRCPVAAPCLGYALVAGERHGVWGGLDPEQRKALSRRCPP